jgi:hypothetical protein
MNKVIGLALALAIASPALAASPVGDPVALIRKLYASDALAQAPPTPLWWAYLTGNAASSLAHVRRVEKETGDDLIDDDFLCQCQDAGDIRLASVTLSDRTAGAVTAHVRFRDSDGPNALTIALVRDGVGWKIAEMTDSHGHTYTAENAEALKDYPGK